MRGVFLVLVFVFVLQFASALTGEIITGKVPQTPTNVSLFVEPGAPIIYIHSPKNQTYYSTNILLNYSIKNQLNNSWYNLDNSGNISLGNFSNNSLFFTATLGNHVLYFFANNSLGNSSENVTFAVSNPPTSSSSSSSSGDGGGEGIVQQSFELDTYLMEISLYPQETQTKTITINNPTSSTFNINIELIDLRSFVITDEESFTLRPNEFKNIDLNFHTLRISPSLYFGKIVFSSGVVEKTLNVIMEIKERNALFDINTQVISDKKYFSPGNKVSVLIEMANIGFIGETVDVDLILKLMDLEQNVIFQSQKELIAVKEKVSVTRKIEIPSDIADGQYVIVGEIIYNNIPATSYDTISIKSKNSDIKLWLWILILLIVLGIVFVVWKRKEILKKLKK